MVTILFVILGCIGFGMMLGIIYGIIWAIFRYIIPGLIWVISKLFFSIAGGFTEGISHNKYIEAEFKEIKNQNKLNQPANNPDHQPSTTNPIKKIKSSWSELKTAWQKLILDIQEIRNDYRIKQEIARRLDQQNS